MRKLEITVLRESRMNELSTKLSELDSELAHWLDLEASRQKAHIELIASENYAPRAVMEAQGSILTNKYAEGYPGKRYYGGCEYVDHIEQLAIDRAKALFDVQYANVQPHSGSSANAAVFLALLKPGDRILSMSLSAGGHLTHGFSVNFSGKLYEAYHYGVDPVTGEVDMDEVRKQALKVRPQCIIAGFSAYSKVLDWKAFRDIADEVGAYLLADMAHVAGLVASRHYPSPVDHAHVVTSTTHKTLRGPRSGLILSNEPTLFKKLDGAVFPGTQGGPLVHVIAAKAVCFLLAQSADFKTYQEQVICNAKAMVSCFQERGIQVVSGGTDIHQFSLNLQSANITGHDAQVLFESAHITLNKNSIPNDPLPPRVTSGVRIGTSAITTRGMNEAASDEIAKQMCLLMSDPSSVEEVRWHMQQLAEKYPLENIL